LVQSFQNELQKRGRRSSGFIFSLLKLFQGLGIIGQGLRRQQGLKDLAEALGHDWASFCRVLGKQVN
jgi:hypothetical protein